MMLLWGSKVFENGCTCSVSGLGSGSGIQIREFPETSANVRFLYLEFYIISMYRNDDEELIAITLLL